MKTDFHPVPPAEPLRSSPAAAVLAAVLLVQLVGPLAAAEPARQPPNILWLIAENIGPDLGCYGAGQAVTPNLDRLAAQGMRYARAFATAPVCSPSRSAFMTGMYQIAIGAQNHRSHRTPGMDDHFHLPAGVQPVTHRLVDAGYCTANIATMDGRRIGTGKTDLNFEVEGKVLRPGGLAVPPGTPEWARQNYANPARLFHVTEWAALPEHQPFFAQINFPNVERNPQGWVGQAQNPKHADPAQVVLPPYYPDTPAVRRDWAGYLDSVSGLDVQVGQVLERL